MLERDDPLAEAAPESPLAVTANVARLLPLLEVRVRDDAVELLQVRREVFLAVEDRCAGAVGEALRRGDGVGGGVDAHGVVVA